MRKHQLLFCFLVSVLYASKNYAQDTLFLKNTKKIVAEVLEVEDVVIIYKPFSKKSSNTDVSKIDKTEVLSISYKNGYNETFSTAQAQIDAIQLIDLRTIEGKIIEVDEKRVFLKLPDMAGDLLTSIPIDSIAIIRYANNFEEKYNDFTIKNVSGVSFSKLDDKTTPKDTLLLIDGGKMTGLVTEIDDVFINIAKQSNSETSINKIDRKTVAEIVYSNGYRETYQGLIKIPTVVSESKNKSRQKIVELEEAPSAKKQETLNVSFKQYSPEDLNQLSGISFLSQIPTDGTSVLALRLTSNRMKKVDPRIWDLKDLIDVDLSYNYFKDIPQEIYSFKKLYRLSMDSCYIEEIDKLPKDVDSNALAIISLKGNRITSVDGSIFRLPNLQHLILNNNAIKGIDDVKKDVKLNTRIQSINLSNNRLKEIPKVLSKIGNLSYLDVSNNQLKRINYEVLLPVNIQELNLMGNPITQFPDDLCNLKTIKSLNISRTKISTLSDSIGKLENLTKFHVPEGVNTLPTVMGDMKSLRELFVENNQRMTSIPDFVYSLNRLEALSFSGTKIYQVSPEIGRLKRLKFLSFRNCQLSTIPENLFELPRLQWIDLSGNMIKSVPEKLGSLAQLELINFESSPLTEQSLLTLKKALPYATIKYYSPELGLNYESQPVKEDIRETFVSLLEQCEKGNVNACYDLGKFFENNSDYGLAMKVFYKIGAELMPKGSAQHALAYYEVAEIYNDVGNQKSYNSIYKRRNYSNYADYNDNRNNNKALTIYCQICEEQAADANAYKVMQQACAKASLIYNDLQKNLKELYDYNRKEVERLVGGAGTMADVKATGNYMMNTATTQGGAVAGGLLSIFGTISKSAKESKAERIQNETLKLKEEIEKLRELEEYYINLKK